MIHFFITILSLMSIFQYGLIQKHTLTFRDDGWNGEYLIDTLVVTKHEFMKKIYTNPQSKSLFKKGKRQQVFGYMIGIVGGGMIEWQLGNLISRKPANYPSGIMGIGVSFSSFAIDGKGKKFKQKAIATYN